MRKKSRSTQKIQATISGAVSGQVAVGQNISQVSTKTTVAVTKAEIIKRTASGIEGIANKG